jgi:hypothetical protein
MSQKPQNPQPRFTPERKVNVWAYVLRCVEKQGVDVRSSDGQFLVKQQLRAATDEAGREQ